MVQRKWLGFATGILVLSLAASVSAAELKQIGTLAVPGEPLNGFDISYVDQATNRYYLADRSNKAVDVFDGTSGKMIDRLPGGFAGQLKTSSVSGPNGVVVVGGEAWASDGDSTVKIIDLKTKKVTDTLSTGGKFRVDEMAYDPKAHVVIVANNADEPPFLTLISTKPGHKVMARIAIEDATDGIEQPVYDAVTKRFYVSIPELKKDKAKGAVAVINPASGKLEKLLPVNDCHPNGLVQGPGANLLLGCDAGGKDSGLPPVFVVMKTDGSVVKVIPGLGSADMVTYNPKLKQYYTASRGMPDGPELGVIDAKSNTLVQRIKLPGGNPHSVAVSEKNNHVFLPLSAKDGGCNGCVAVFAPGS